MGYYVIAVGGTGNKILESVVYGACADVFYTQNECGKHEPLPLIHALSVDVDAACGNTTRAKRAAEHYEEIRQAFAASPHKHRCFHTALQLSRWSMGLDKRAASVDGMVQNHLSDQVLSRTLFSKTESSLEYSEGFRGHPDLGVLFFAELLNALEEPQIRLQPDELLDFIDDMQADLHKEETVKVILCGSIFGGTGASGIPALSQYLRKRFADDHERFEMASMLMLPYYEVPKATQNEEQEIVVSSAAFIDKARTALQYYGMSGLMRDGANDASGVFDALYLLGLPPESFVTTRNYATGSQSQENDAHLLEWLATRCLSKFFRTGFRGQDARNIDCYYYQWHSPTLSWQSFDLESDLYRVQYGALLKAAAVFFAECYPTLRLRVSAAHSQSKRVNYCAPYFYRVGRYPMSERAKLEKHLNSLYQFFAFYCNWLIQIIRTLPPTLREGESAAISSQNDLPQNSLLCAELLGELSRLLHEYGTTAALRDHALFDSACLALQKGLQRLVTHRVPDRRNLAYVIAALGGSTCDAKNADAALCGFLGTLLQAVAEEEVQ